MMKRVYPLLYLMLFSTITHAQKTVIKWGEEFKLRRGSTDLRVISADNDGAYLEESHVAMKAYFVVGASFRESASLVKVDKNLTEVYRNDFNKELRGKEFVQFFACQEKLFLFSSDYSKRDRTLALYASAVNKKTGELTGEWREVATFRKDEKRDDIDFKIGYNADSTTMLIVSSVEGSEKNEYKIQELDKNLKATAKPLILSNEFERKKYQLEDVLYTNDRKIILVGRMFEYEEGKKKKEKFLDFTNYNIRIYNNKGKQEAEINTGINGKWLSSTKLVQEKNKDLVLAAFYSNTKKGRTIDGLLVQRINVTDGKVISTSDRKINNSLLSGDQDKEDEDDTEDKDESREERKMRAELGKMKDEGEGFSRHMQFRKIFYTADDGLVILAEQYRHYITTSQSYTPGSYGSPSQWRSSTYAHYLSGDLMMCKIDAAGNIGWLQILPKDQREIIMMNSSSAPTGGIYYHSSYFNEGNRPFYSGFGALQANGSIQLLINDHAKNHNVTQAGQKAKAIARYAKSNCYLVSIDETSGKVTRKVFFSNDDIPTAMPRLGAIVGNDMYIVGKTDRMMGKSKIAIGKITSR
ncbi:hypothetical protein HF324_31050 [Chitinophaga oryzae]|uniref:Uncharacterized protein n=1 Tax=Chitinophaga oryzae TaxID=2725414 RepID=A0AAE6ZM22_9BACT|nr:hypothetical protein [Chitinophaga oryzae]QJB35501.1 hypothetical protein HF329_31030 [Chitinophaga oryzae]QJB42044.1 hypothetical protein HF324_31050 [Chitinophaga oryzae]